MEKQNQLSELAKQKLTKQHYRIVGSHTAVKTCGWTKNMINGIGGCYKLRFYGIMSHQCMQMSPSISCANRCTFCWRDYKAPVAKEWEWNQDDPDMILEESQKAHHKLLEGFNKNKKTKQHLYEQSKEIKHVALSLTGEPINYPKINKLIDGFNKSGISTFLVTNAQFPAEMKSLNPVTQLYISLDAPEKILLKTIDNPLFEDYWERLMTSLDHLAAKKQRTCIRLTMIKNQNMKNPQKYAELIKKGNPDFLEVKSYMHVGASRERLSRDNMPSMEEVEAFTQEILKHLEGYEIVTQHKPSLVLMLARKEYFKDGRWHTWIDFPKYHELVNSGKDFTTDDYLTVMPENLAI